MRERWGQQAPAPTSHGDEGQVYTGLYKKSPGEVCQRGVAHQLLEPAQMIDNGKDGGGS